MADQEWVVRMRRPDGEVVEGLVKATGSRTIFLSLIGPGVRSLGRGFDYFGALLDARRDFEAAGWRVLVNGACRDVWPSPMLSDMGQGLKAYRLRVGEKPGRSDLVEVFGADADLEPATVGEQEAFRGSWLRSVVPSDPLERTEP